MFQKSLKEGYVKEILVDKLRAQSLIKAAKEALLTANEISLNDYKYKSIIRELYEALRQYCEAIGYLQGYKFESHEVITHFLKEELNKENISLVFEKYRKIRNGVNYYGRDIPKETVEKALIEIPEVIKQLEVYTKSSIKP